MNLDPDWQHKDPTLYTYANAMRQRAVTAEQTLDTIRALLNPSTKEPTT